MKEWLRRVIKPIPEPEPEPVTLEDLRKMIGKVFPDYHLARNPGETRRKNREERRGKNGNQTE
jgi:hypothetical protein